MAMRYSKKSTFDNPNIRDLALNVGMGRKDTGHAHIDVENIQQKVGFPVHKEDMTEATENKKTDMAKLKIKDYLPYFHRGKQSTKLRNARKLKKFCEWAKKTPDELIAEYRKAKDNNDLDSWERDRTNEILEFYNWFREAINPRTGKKYSINYCNTETSGILAFHHQNTRYLEHIMDSFAPTQMPTNEYRFSQDDLRKMFYYGDTEEKR